MYFYRLPVNKSCSKGEGLIAFLLKSHKKIKYNFYSTVYSVNFSAVRK